MELGIVWRFLWRRGFGDDWVTIGNWTPAFSSPYVLFSPVRYFMKESLTRRATAALGRLSPEQIVAFLLLLDQGSAHPEPSTPEQPPRLPPSVR